MEKRLDDFTIVRTIGEGGFSKVKLVTDSAGNTFAAKIFKKFDEELKERRESLMRNEIENMKTLTHQHILQLIKFSENGVYQKNDELREVKYSLMEFCQNGSLYDFLAKNGCMDERLCRFYFTQLLNAVEYCHLNGICHRDIKPENILLDNSFNLKLADLGFSCSLMGRTGTGELWSDLGTSMYKAPEIENGHSYHGTKIDVFALGVVLYIMVVYCAPFKKASRVDAFYRMLFEDENKYWNNMSRAMRSRSFSPDFKGLFKAMVHPDPNLRVTIEQIRNSNWFNGPRIGPLVYTNLPSGEVVLSAYAEETRQNPSHSNKYRDLHLGKTSSLCEDDYQINSISDQEFGFLKYLKFEVRNTLQSLAEALTQFLDKGFSYTGDINKLKFKAKLHRSEDERVKFKLICFKKQEIVVVHFQKIKGDEFLLIEQFNLLKSLLKKY